MLSTASVVVWVVGVVGSKNHHPFNFWAVVTLALLLAGALLWGVRRGDRSGEGGTGVQYQAETMHFYYGAPTGAPPGAPSTTEVPPEVPRASSVRVNENVFLPDLVRRMRSPLIDGVEFRNCRIRGPAVVHPLENLVIEDTGIDAAGDWRSLFLEIPPDRAGGVAVGIIGLKNCRFIGCEITHVAFIGPPDQMADIRHKCGLP